MLRHWLGAAVPVVLVLTACTDREASDATLGPLSSPGATTTTVTAAPPPTEPGPATTAGDPAAEAVGAGFVSIRVRLASSGVDEALSLDRATVATEDLDPISLDAFCTALDDGEGWTVSVTDLRRLSAGSSRLVSAVLRIDTGVSAPGVYEGTLEVGDTAQQVTIYGGPITVDPGLSSGSFDLRDAGGRAATGAFVCAPEPVPTTTLPPPAATGSVPADEPPPAGPTAPPLPTVPAATS